MDSLFLDTSFAIALSSRRDQHHQRAVELAAELRNSGTSLVTTVPVVIEIGNSLARQSFRAAAVSLIRSLHADSNVTIHPIGQSLYNQAFTLFSDREDKDWGFTDCISFVLMESQGLTKALTADHHFVQAGFEALLK